MVKDQYKYFRIEARELIEGLGRAVLELERGEGGKESIACLLRFAHTLKGASRVVKQPEIAELAHAIEDAFAPYRDGNAVIPPERINQVLAMLDVIAAKVASLDLPDTADATETRRPSSEELFETVRVEIEEMDTLLDSVSEASVQLTALRREVETIERARHLAGSLLESMPPQKTEDNGTSSRSFAKSQAIAEELRNQIERLKRNFAPGLDQVDAEFAQVSDATNRLRLLPAAIVFASLERVARDAAQSLHKQVLFVPIGGANRMDTHVLTALRDALPHVVRNAVAHGIELPGGRAAAGKPLQGRVELRVERRGNRVAFICSDDGRGIDLEAVRQTAVRKGLVPAANASSLGLEDAVQIILRGGLSTAGTVNEVSGRGIGLDVVRETTARLKGEVSIRSEAGKGTSVEICVPVSLSSLNALRVEAGGAVAALPLDAIHQTLRIADSDVAHSAEKDSIVFEGKVIPHLVLSGALRMKMAPGSKRHSWPAIILQGSAGMAAIGVDRLLDTGSVVVRPLPSLTDAEAIVAGASVDTAGNPQLVLDPEALIARAQLARAAVVDSRTTQRASVLVVDDSLTTRMLEQSILESAGYEVDVATSGEEGIEKARGKQYGLFLVDVEMPGMDGFEFVRRTRADLSLRTVPAILVTSRNAVEDFRRGEQAGARGYMVKGEFDQVHLLQMISEFMG